MRVADFFCGGGGFSEGFRQAGFNIVFAVDKWEPAITTYKGNKPGVNAILDDVIRISNLPDDEFEALVPDSEVIIGSPPCQSFSHSNKSGNADKSIGIQLIEAYLKIIARKKYKKNSILKYWVLENVPSVKEYIKSEYTAADLGLEGSFVLKPHEGNSGKYNAKYYGAPTNRERYLCGEFPPLQQTNTDDNVKTLADVLASYGIVTSDGTIVDGNRRAMLLNRLFHKRDELGYSYEEVEKCKYFLAIILPDDAEEKDIQQLETIYQMGEDDKLDYNPIEKYLKCKELKRLGFSEEDIAGFMSEKPSQVKEWLSILDLMEDYLKEYDYEGIYTRLEKTEGPFVDLENYLDSYKKRGANVRSADWTYTDSDISDLKLVCFDYIRARYEGKEFRDIAS